jgi:hypothetical protein
MRPDVIVSVSDKYLWALRPFAYLFNKYWSYEQRVVVAGYTPPDFDLPRNFLFYSISVPCYDKDHWGDGLMEFFQMYTGEQFVFMLEDYWIQRKVDTNAIEVFGKYLEQHPDVLRVDLTGDRLYAGGMKDIGSYDRYDLIEAPGSQYQLSLQAGIWNKSQFLKVLSMLPDEKRSAWAFELDGSYIVNSFGDRMRVVGTRNWPLRYANGMNNAAGKRIFYNGLDEQDIIAIHPLVPEEYKGIDNGA